MVTTSYPRFPGDTVGTFMEPIARGLAARGHEVHVVAPWHPLVTRGPKEDGVYFHFFHYAPLPALNVFGYANALRADVALRPSAIAVAPFALITGWQVARRVAKDVQATVIHGHWVVPGGVLAAAVARSHPLVISIHGSDIYLAERSAWARRATRAALRRATRVTACSEDLRSRAIALGGIADRIEVLPYGVDACRFRPDTTSRAKGRTDLGVKDKVPLIFTAGRLVRKKGFEYLLEAVALLSKSWPTLLLVIAGSGDLEDELRERLSTLGIVDHVRLLGSVKQDRIPTLLAAADVAVVPSVRDEAGNVDGLPNTVLEAMSSGTPLVATTAGGINAVAVNGRTAILVPERDVIALAGALDTLLKNPEKRVTLGRAAREEVRCKHTWEGVAERFEEIYESAGKENMSNFRRT